jgi:hypothetical protein
MTNHKTLLALVFISMNSYSQEIVVPDQTVTPWSFPEDCRMLQYNAGAISKKLTEMYKDISENPTKKTKELEAIKNLSDVSASLAKTYEVFCKR